MSKIMAITIESSNTGRNPIADGASVSVENVDDGSVFKAIVTHAELVGGRFVYQLKCLCCGSGFRVDEDYVWVDYK